MYVYVCATLRRVGWLDGIVVLVVALVVALVILPAAILILCVDRASALVVALPVSRYWD